MADTDIQSGCIGGSSLVASLASEGVEFLLSPRAKVPLQSLHGKKICLFFSANWCRPCKSFTPLLLQLFDTLRKKRQELEIIFISFDHDEQEFNDYYKCMPWLAVPFNSNLHRKLSEKYHVDRIPSLIPLNPDGVSVEDDSIDLVEDYGAEAYPFTALRREQLKAIDHAKRRGAKIEELLAHDEQSYVVSRDGRKVPISQLVGKTIGLYFGAYWCPPCRAFTGQLTEAYNELIGTTKRDSLEIILVSTDRDLKEFEVNMSSMPWLAIPYEDRIRQDLGRIFNVKGIPALIFIGPEGKTVSTNGKEMISLYGAKSFPFTESRIAEIEETLKREGEKLPQQVKDMKHEHVLKLDMAKAYVCDECKKQGKYWAFSCEVCDYDLHPTCVQDQQEL